MALSLSSPVTDISRIGPAKAKYLQKLGIRHTRDFLYTFPRRYDDFSTVTAIKDLVAGRTITIRGRVKKVTTNWGFRGRRRLLRIFVDIADDTGTLAVTWFNLRFLAKQLWEGRELYVAGKVEENSRAAGGRSKQSGVRPRFRMRSPVIEFVNQGGEQTHTASITPVYPETYGVTSRFLRYQVKNVLPLLAALPEYLPAAIRRHHKFMGIREAIAAIHFPASAEQLAAAQKRLRFDELFFLQLAALVRRQNRQRESAMSVAHSKAALRAFAQKLPYVLTDAQTQAIDEIASDLAKTTPMNRLLQGDVGSGKSACAAAAIHLVVEAGAKALYLAPTEVLARQQYESFKTLLGADRVALLLGAMPRRQREKVQQRMTAPGPVCVFGTHTLLQENISATNLALAVVDEQHRFGVRQRQALRAAGTGTNPHLLSMTATPIPRTLHLTVLGDLDVSVLDEMPAGRKPIRTKIVPLAERDEAVLHILEELHQGRQAYVIAPLIEQSEKLEVKSAKEAAAEMQKLFPDIAVGLLHGHMSSEEKEGALRNFSAGALQLLVATSIVEVGVNVPNATIMIIEGAERFGLSQLHQFRGRIGRGEDQSYCYLFPTTENGTQNPRLKALAATTDGFTIAEEDLKLRGPGEVYGVAQSGFADLKVASLMDYPTIKLARTEAEKLLDEDPQLKEYPILKAKVAQKNLSVHLE
jgi:ATP-dependent DNA helicase RecG